MALILLGLLGAGCGGSTGERTEAGPGTTEKSVVAAETPRMVASRSLVGLAGDWLQLSSASLKVAEANTSDAILALAREEAVAALVHRLPTSGEQQLAGANTLVAGPHLKSLLVGRAPVGIVVHGDNPLGRLEVADVRRLLAGEIGDWEDVGGAPGKPVLFGTDLASPSGVLVQTWLMGTAQPSPSVRALPSIVDVGLSVAREPRAMGWGLPSSEGSRHLTVTWDGVDRSPGGKVTGADGWPMHLPIYLVTRDRASSSVGDLAEVARSPSGRAVAERFGYLAPQGWSP